VKTKPRRPIARYHGGKYRLADKIIPFFPPHECYVEVFGGVFSIGLLKDPAKINVYNDIDSDLINLFSVLRDPELSNRLRLLIETTLFSRDEFGLAWLKSDDSVEEARRFIVRSFQSIGAKNRLSANGWRVRTPKSIWSPCSAWNSWPENIPLFFEILRNTIIENLDFRKLIPIYDHADTLFYVDPPYLQSTRSKDHRHTYSHELNESDHLELLELLRSAKSMIVLSGYPSPLYDSHLRDWSFVDIKARAQNNSPRIERLWFNESVSRSHGLFGGLATAGDF
jgi:DNA adenine methylase